MKNDLTFTFLFTALILCLVGIWSEYENTQAENNYLKGQRDSQREQNEYLKGKDSSAYFIQQITPGNR